jgi:hypothetical protein
MTDAAQTGASGCNTLPVALSLSPRTRVVNIIPTTLSGETSQDSEPFLAVNPVDPRRMVATAFTPNPNGSSATTAPVFVSENGGLSWRLSNIVPSTVMTGDITVAGTGTPNRLYGGILRRPGYLLLNELTTADFTSPTVMTVLASRSQVDQPFVRAFRAAGNDRVYVGNNDFAAGLRTATVDVSNDGGGTWASARIEARTTSGQDGPSIRPAVAPDGTVYAAYFGWRSFSGSVATSDVVVVRDDAWGGGATPFRALLGADGQPGVRVVQSVTIPWSNAPTLGQERIGSTLSTAVDPSDSAVVYVAWGDRVGNGDIYTIHVRRSTDRGATWSPNDLLTITDATNVALAVGCNGTVGVLFQQVTGSGASSRWVTHLVQTRNAFGRKRDAVLATVPATTPAFQFLPYIGDYAYLLASGSEFRGVFSANNTPDFANFPQGVVYQRQADFNTHTLSNGTASVGISIDPFFFSVPMMD